MMELYYYLIVSLIVFIIGMIGFFIRRNLITLLMCVELMLNAANLALMVFGTKWGWIEAQAIVLLVMTVAAAEVAVGLALMIVVYKHYSHLFIDQMTKLKG
ncbi:MAG: NADH-quinone oxidoreductase subunit K [Candidatus Fischerbacteria bacterium RBG_13_37_8]|uniref:NADH-quinone oxidoreductase subunit K n=1 Tax=Candidatus Fischerbacteria bacterium RBG_13_37_8 TaxID=1817863 RepID=A0A1F5V8H3_9BACT|nr:MAG: NADH-quinone oxidoreductase subunit K [Candidatus Fischerbacteria bacterium RBG_13_37_8]